MSSIIALTAVAGLAAASLIRKTRQTGNANHGKPSIRELRRRAQADLDSGFCGDSEDYYIYHVAPIEKLHSISVGGLRPNETEPGFVGFQAWSRGKVFLSGGKDAMNIWMDTLKSSQRRNWTSRRWIPIRIKLDSLAYKMIRSDYMSEFPCSFFVTRAIEPKHLEVQDGTGSWVDLTPEIVHAISSEITD